MRLTLESAAKKDEEINNYKQQGKKKSEKRNVLLTYKSFSSREMENDFKKVSL